MVAQINRNFYRRHPKKKKRENSKEKSENMKKCHSEVYDTVEWRKLRLQKLMDSPICERCWELYGKVTPALDIHHRIPILEDPEKAFEYDNLMSLCRKCHITIHKEMREKKEEENRKEFENIKKDIQNKRKE